MLQEAIGQNRLYWDLSTGTDEPWSGINEETILTQNAFQPRYTSDQIRTLYSYNEAKLERDMSTKRMLVLCAALDASDVLPETLNEMIEHVRLSSLVDGVDILVVLNNGGGDTLESLTQYEQIANVRIMKILLSFS